MTLPALPVMRGSGNCPHQLAWWELHSLTVLSCARLQCNISSRLARPTWTGHLAPQLQTLYVSAFAPLVFPPAGRQRAAAAAQREASAEPPYAERPLPEDAAMDGGQLPDVGQDHFIPGRSPPQVARSLPGLHRDNDCALQVAARLTDQANTHPGNFRNSGRVCRSPGIFMHDR